MMDVYKIYFQASKEMDAMTLGNKRFITMSRSELKDHLSSMNKSEKNAFIDGFSDRVSEKMGARGEGSIGNMAFLDTPNMCEKLKMVVGDDKKIDAFLDTIKAERIMRKQFYDVARGSRTAMKKAAEEHQKCGVITSVAQATLQNDLIGGLLDVIRNAPVQSSIKNADEVGDMLFGVAGPERIKKLLKDIKATRADRRWANTELPKIIQAAQLPVINETTGGFD